jgi:hypothetical protein
MRLRYGDRAPTSENRQRSKVSEGKNGTRTNNWRKTEMKRVTKGALVMAAVSALSLSATMAQDRSFAARSSATTMANQPAATRPIANDPSAGQQGYRITPDGVNGWTTRRSTTGWTKNQPPGIAARGLRSWFEQ